MRHLSRLRCLGGLSSIMETDILGNSIASVCIQQSLKCQHSLLKKKKTERKIHLTLFSFGSELVLKRAKLKMNRIHSGGFKRWVGEGGILSISFPGWPSLLIRGSAASVQLLCSAGIQSACVVPQFCSCPWDRAVWMDSLHCLLMIDIQFPWHSKL